VANDYVEYKFYGSKIRADLYKNTNTGIARITIDGRDDLCNQITLTGGQALVDTYSLSAGTFQVDVANNLSEGWHTIRITVTGTKNASSTDYRVYFEKYVYWQSIYSEYEYVDTLSLTLISDGQFKYPSTVDEMAISVEGVWSGSWHGNSRPSVAGVHKIIIDGVETVLNVGDIKYCKQVAFEQDIVHYTGSGDFATNKLKHIFNHEGLNIRNDFTLTRQVTISEFYPIMGEAFGDCIKVSNSLNKIVLQKNNTETNLGYAPYSALVAQDLYNSLYLIQPLDIVNSKINNPSSNHFFVDKSQGYAKFYYRAEKGLKDIGYNVKTSTLYSFAHCKNPSYFI
jgi:hypothetical protein